MGKPILVIERILPATPSVVFEHWSDPESLSKWMLPDSGMTLATVEVDFRVGGRFEIVMHGDIDYRQHGHYLDRHRSKDRIRLDLRLDA